MLCPNCGNQIPDNSKWCPNCGQGTKKVPTNKGVSTPSPVQSNYPPQQPYYPPQQPVYPPQPPFKPADDEPSIGLNILSFLFPLIGWVLYFVYKDDKPVRAKSCSRWAWISFIISFVIGFIGGMASV